MRSTCVLKPIHMGMGILESTEALNKLICSLHNADLFRIQIFPNAIVYLQRHRFFHRTSLL